MNKWIFTYQGKDAQLFCESVDSLKAKWAQDVEIVEGLLEQAKEIACPKGIVCEAEITAVDEKWIEIEGHKIKSGFVADYLKDLKKVYPYVVTCGRELHDWYEGFEDIIEKYIAESIAEMYINTALMPINKFVEANFVAEKIAAFNPGSLEAWPVSGQRELFDIIGSVETDIGVELTESFLMLPRKSCSGIYFSSEHKYQNCMYCPRINCPNRSAPYNYEM